MKKEPRFRGFLFSGPVLDWRTLWKPPTKISSLRLQWLGFWRVLFREKSGFEGYPPHPPLLNAVTGAGFANPGLITARHCASDWVSGFLRPFGIQRSEER